MTVEKLKILSLSDTKHAVLEQIVTSVHMNVLCMYISTSQNYDIFKNKRRVFILLSMNEYKISIGDNFQERNLPGIMHSPHRQSRHGEGTQVSDRRGTCVVSSCRRSWHTMCTAPNYLYSLQALGSLGLQQCQVTGGRRRCR